MLSDKEFEELKAKINLEFPIRQKLAKILGRKLKDETVRDLFVDILIHEPSRDNQARMIIRGEIK